MEEQDEGYRKVAPDEQTETRKLRASLNLYEMLSLKQDADAAETRESHRDRLFLQVLLSLGVNTLALLVIFYTILPLTEQGRSVGSIMLWSSLTAIVLITAVFVFFNARILCVNLLLLGLTLVLAGGSFVLGGVMSPTMIFLLAIPVLAATLTHSGWAYLWTAITVGFWLLLLVLESNGVQMKRVTLETNIASIQVLALLGTAIIVMSVLASFIASNSRLRTAMEIKNERLNYLATHDPLTDIPNRRAFVDHAQKCVQRARRSGKPFAVVVVDLNNFKQINDALGHKVGDAVLQHFAQRLKNGFRETDFIARLGGDEFGIVLEPMEERETLVPTLDRFFQEAGKNVEVDGHTVNYDCATGMALFPEDGETVTALYEEADAAMYRSKRTGPDELRWR